MIPGIKGKTVKAREYLYCKDNNLLEIFGIFKSEPHRGKSQCSVVTKICYS